MNNLVNINNLYLAKKIAIFGWPASGKSTLANFLSDKFNIELYSLDIIRWKYSEDGVKDDRKFLAEYEEILKRDEWIIDGNALDWIDSRLKGAHILIFFDSTIDKCTENYINRERRVESNKEVRFNFDSSKTTNEIVHWIKNRYSKKIIKLKRVLHNYKDKLIIINNYEELNYLIKSLNKS